MAFALVPGNTLITATPEEGRQLAFKLARLTIKATQPDDAMRGKLRDVYANDASMLMQAGHTVASSSPRSPLPMVTGARNREHDANFTSANQTVHGCRHEVALPHRSFRQDCLLYFRDLSVAAIVFVPLWIGLYQWRIFLSGH